MTERLAIYYAPQRGSRLDVAAEGWLARADIAAETVSARRYGMHATIKAPMALAAGMDADSLAAALTAFGRRHRPVDMGRLVPRLIDGFLALVPAQQSQALTDFAATVVADFEPFRAPLSAEDRTRRLRSPLTSRQIELLDAYGYPYVLEEFRFHMTLTDRLPVALQPQRLAEAEAWFADVLAAPVALDRLVLFTEPAPGDAFVRLEPDFMLSGFS